MWALTGPPMPRRPDAVFESVLAQLPHDGDGEGVAIADDLPYGSSRSVWSGDRERAIEMSQHIRTGTIGINGGLWYSPDVPFGGYTQSGIGRKMDVAGLDEYLQITSLVEPA